MDADRARDTLRQLLQPDQHVYMIERHRSRSGGQSVVQFLIVSANRTITPISKAISSAVPGMPAFDGLRSGLAFTSNAGMQPAGVVAQLSGTLFGRKDALLAEWID